MLAHRLPRWPHIKTTVGERLVFAGLLSAKQEFLGKPLSLSDIDSQLDSSM